MAVRQYIGARYVPKFSDVNNGEWDNTYSYESLIIVKHGNDYYTSKIPVPTGVAITDTTYWVKTGDYNGAISTLNDRIDAVENKLYVYECDLSNDDIQEIIDSIDSYAIIHCINERNNNDTIRINNKHITIIGGSFRCDARACTIDDYGVRPIFMVNNTELTLIDCKFKANSYGEYPFIYARSGINPGSATDSNVEAVSADNSKIFITNCDLINVMGCYGHNSLIRMSDNNAITSMFVFSENSKVFTENNSITMQESNITSYYHTYYPNTESTLTASNDNIVSLGHYQDLYSGGVSGVSADATFNNIKFYGNIGTRLLTHRAGTIKIYNSDFVITNDMTDNSVTEGTIYNTSINIAKCREMFNQNIYTFTDGLNISSATGNPYADPTTSTSEMHSLDGIKGMLLDGSLSVCKIALYDAQNTFIRLDNAGYYFEVPSNATQFRIVRKIGERLFGYIYK